ncbi:Dihydroanticapsin 7-dehydrogenase [Methylobacterium hispanicum]|uniref:Dihydroanticapsin 7-dehydrogenase n=1 Tax=Methylobacterium hispanicum TaxID=270350 RepID=A0AAV4ZV59_9HYPH|nr:Dihydroanticapsin 7-dehydrogenase [Methylobacterium hispanicum]
MDRTWFITGSSRGLGRALAQAVVAAGERLCATARDPAALADLVEAGGERVLAVPLVVSDEAGARRAVEATAERFGRIDVLVNNAGNGDVAPIEETDLASFRAQVETNLFGVVNVTKAAIPLFRAQRRSHFLQVSFIGGEPARPGAARTRPRSSAWRGSPRFSPSR